MTKTALHILLVEDTPAHILLFQKRLARAYPSAHHLDIVESLGEALSLLQHAAFDLVILDLSLPDADGLRGLQQVLDIVPDTPVVVHSMLNDHTWIIDAIKHGAQNYLIKDQYDAEHLNQVITSALELKLTQRGLRKEQRLQRIVETTADGMIVVDAEGRIQFFNQAAERLLRWDRDHLINAEFGFPLVVGEMVELDVLQHDGSVIVVEMRATPILWEEQLAYLVSLHDITTHRALRDQLTTAKEKAEELARLKTSLLANISHELRTPLTGILGFAEVLINEATNAQHREFATIIKQAGTRLLETINSVLTLSQLEGGAIKVAAKKIRLLDVVSEVIALMQPLAQEKQLTLDLLVTEPDVTVYADRILLHRILYNLIGNAIKFTDHGQITAEIGANKDQVFLRVCDTGQGIDAKFLPHLFEEFRQEDLGDGRSHEGNGLGLAITKRLITLMEGTISVKSIVNVGTTFTVTFPSTTSSTWGQASRAPATYSKSP